MVCQFIGHIEITVITDGFDIAFIFLLCKELNNIANSKTLKNLVVRGNEILNIVSFEKMEKLEQLVLSGGGESYATNIDYMSIIELPNIKSVIYPFSLASYGDLEDVLTSDLAQKIASNENITAFSPGAMAYDWYEICMSETDRQFIKELYSAGIDDGLLQDFIRKGWRYGEESTYEDFCDVYGY